MAKVIVDGNIENVYCLVEQAECVMTCMKITAANSGQDSELLQLFERGFEEIQLILKPLNNQVGHEIEFSNLFYLDKQMSQLLAEIHDKTESFQNLPDDAPISVRAIQNSYFAVHSLLNKAILEFEKTLTDPTFKAA